jgi:hypothetical protein
VARGQADGVSWTRERVEAIQLALRSAWLRPGQAASALGVHRATVDNCMRDGRLTWSRLGGRKLRSVASLDVLRMVLEEINRDEQLDYDMGHCSRTFAANVRAHVEAHTRPPFPDACDQRCAANGERTD